MDFEDIALGGLFGLLLSMVFGKWLPERKKQDEIEEEVEEAVEKHVTALT